jgi:CheY-like chemotaxis protein
MVDTSGPDGQGSVGASDDSQEQLDLNEIVRTALDLTAPLARFGKVIIEESLWGSLMVKCPDRERTTAMVLHLLAHSLLALTCRSASRELRISTSRAEDSSALLLVIDNGPTDPLPRRLDCVRSIFLTGSSQAPQWNVSAGVEGGLNKVVASFGEAIARPRPVERCEPKEGETGAGARILIVDDDEGLVDLLVQLLKPRGYVVDTALDGYQGLCKMRAGRHDLVLLDMQMPNVDGALVLRASSKETLDIRDRVIVLTAHLDPYKGFLDENQISYMAKPFQTDAVLDLVQSKLKRLRQEPLSVTVEPGGGRSGSGSKDGSARGR